MRNPIDPDAAQALLDAALDILDLLDGGQDNYGPEALTAFQAAVLAAIRSQGERPARPVHRAVPRPPGYSDLPFRLWCGATGSRDTLLVEGGTAGQNSPATCKRCLAAEEQARKKTGQGG